MPGSVANQADLHTHSTASDGLDSPAELVRLASERGISVLALTDHDTVGGIPEARSAAEELGIEFVSGVEFSIRARRGQTHILGYGVDEQHERLATELRLLRAGRQERGVQIVQRLQSLGIEIEQVFRTPKDAEHAPGRPHIARRLVEMGVVNSVQDAFDQYLAVGRPAFVPRRMITASDAIEIIHQAGGVSVLAHPLSVYQFQDKLPEFIDAGLDGLEAHYGEYDQDQRKSLARLATDYNLLSTGGSDYHGDLEHRHRVLGSVNWPESDLEAIRKRLK